MAAGEGEKGGSKVKLDEFTAKVVPDPKNPTDALLLTGFLGASSEGGQTRIYWDASLSSFVDVDTADILHTEPLPKAQSPLGGAYIWVKRSAEVSVGSAAGRSAKGKFFQGPLMTAYGGAFGGAATGAGGETAAGAAGLTPGAAALPKSVLCPTRLMCHSWEPCYTRRYECPTIWGACPSPFPFYCAAGEAAVAGGAAAPVTQFWPCWPDTILCITLGCPHHSPGFFCTVAGCKR